MAIEQEGGLLGEPWAQSWGTLPKRVTSTPRQQRISNSSPKAGMRPCHRTWMDPKSTQTPHIQSELPLGPSLSSVRLHFHPQHFMRREHWLAGWVTPLTVHEAGVWTVTSGHPASDPGHPSSSALQAAPSSPHSPSTAASPPLCDRIVVRSEKSLRGLKHQKRGGDWPPPHL